MSILTLAALPVCFVIFVLSFKKALPADDEMDHYASPAELDGKSWKTTWKRAISDCGYAMAIAADLEKAGVPYRLCLERKEDGNMALGGPDTFSIEVMDRDRDALARAGERWLSDRTQFVLEAKGHGRAR